jgi:adenylate cyclase
MGVWSPIREIPVPRWKNIFDSSVPYVVATTLLVGLSLSPINETINLLIYDMITGVRSYPSGRNKPITIIGIDESDISAHGWPIDDQLFCDAIDNMLAAGAVAIGLDVYRDRGVGDEQECLQERFRTDPRLVSIFNAAEGIAAIPGTPDQRKGFNDLIVDPDGVIRRDLVHVAGQDEATVSFPLRLLEVGFGPDPLRSRLEQGTDPGPWLELESGGYQQLDAAGYQEMLAFHALGSFPTWSLNDVLSRSTIPADQLKGKIVLIGSTAPSLRDLFPVPHTRFAVGPRQYLIPGVELHAHRLASLMDRSKGNGLPRMWTLPGWGERGLEMGCVLLGIALGESFQLLRRSILMVGLSAACLTGAAVTLLYHYVWIAPTMPLASLVGMAGASWVRRGGANQQQRRQIEKLLGQTTSPEVAKHLWNQRDSLLSHGRFEGRQLPVTIMMLDTCNFTGLSETLSPRALLDWINRGMAEFVPAITHRGGMVNKFTGDGLLAVFGAPLSHGSENDAKAAVEAALAIQNAVIGLNEQLSQEGSPAMLLRIGLHSGDVLAGSMGSSERIEYAVIGDTVNCAARLESVEKERQINLCRVLASSTTRELLKNDPKLDWKSWGSITLRGRKNPIDVWEINDINQMEIQA